MKKTVLQILLLFLFTTILTARTINITVMDLDIDIPLEGVKLHFKNIEQTVVTGPDGSSTIEIEERVKRLMIHGDLIGYELLDQLITDIPEKLILYMSISSIIQGTELVVEEESSGTTDEELGVSIVLTNEELKSTSEIGLIEDVISSIKMLPGVSFSGSFNTLLSIRGGSPGELTTVLDGFIIRFPFHWGGAYSVFNPNTVSSVKFSNGIFSVKHGLAISGLLEIESIKPDKGLRFEFGGGTTTVEALLQTPVGLKNAGLFIGGRITFLDLATLMYEFMRVGGIIENTGLTFSMSPFIRDAYFKWYHKPHKRVEWYVNGLFASDGIGIAFEDPGKDPSTDIVNTFDFTWYNFDAVGVVGIKALPVDRLFIHGMAGYEFLLNRLRGKNREFGQREYSDAFKTVWDQFLLEKGNSTEYTLGPNSSDFTQDSILNSIQTRLDFDITLHERVLFSVGTGIIADFVNYGAAGSFYSPGDGTTDISPATAASLNLPPGTDTIPILTFFKTSFSVSGQNKRILKTFAYVNTEIDVIPNIFSIDVGIRLDHFVLFANTLTVNTYPVAGPRLTLNWTALSSIKPIKHLSFSLGNGLFSKVPFAEIMINDDMDLDDFSIQIPQTLITVIGSEIEFDFGLRIKLEGYYKFYFNQLYTTTSIDGNNFTSADFDIHSDGIGHAAGFDIMIQRKTSRFVDGWLSYSFIYAKYMNPVSGTGGLFGNSGPITEQWYYPGYHRFHTLNLVLNLKPTAWMTITSTFSLASGVPVSEFGYKMSLPAELENGQFAEWYFRDTNYSDTLRSDISIPLDLKISFHHFFKKSKVQFEAYVAVEDLFSALYTPTGGVSTDRFTGETQPSPESQLNIPFPMPSIGFKINY